MSSPSKVIQAAKILFEEQNFLYDISISTFRIIMGFLVSVFLAVPIGILMGSFKFFEAFLSPFVSFIRYLPVPALLPFCILWFGIGEVEKIIVVFIGVFFQLVLLIAAVVSNVPDELLSISYTLGAKTKDAIFKVVVPFSSPHIFDSLRVTVGWAWGWLILAELVGANRGIGFMILKSQRYLINANMIVGLLVLGVLGILTDLTFMGISKVAFRWRAPAS